MRCGLALLQVITLGVLLNINSLAACPFLQPENPVNSHACCRNLKPPHQKAPEPKCPISPTMDTCPLNMTEAKLGTLKGKADTLYPPSPVTGALLSNWRSAVVVPPGPLADAPDESKIFLKIRVLRI